MHLYEILNTLIQSSFYNESQTYKRNLFERSGRITFILVRKRVIHRHFYICFYVPFNGARINDLISGAQKFCFLLHLEVKPTFQCDIAFFYEFVRNLFFDNYCHY